MDGILYELSPEGLIAANEENMFAFFRYATVAEVHDDAELLWWITDDPEPIFNMLFRARLTEESADGAIEAAIARARGHKVPLFWWTGPSTRPLSLESSLVAHGFEREIVPGMAIDLEDWRPAPPVAGLVIEQVENPTALRQWCDVVAKGLGSAGQGAERWFETFTGLDYTNHRPLRLYLGSVAGVPVASSALYMAEGVAGIYCVATLPEYRRRGIAAAMTSQPLVEAAALGYRAGTLQASQMGARIYEGLGFRKVCDIGIYYWAIDGAGS